MSYQGRAEDGTWSRWLNPWRDVPMEQSEARVRRTIAEDQRQRTYYQIVEKARGASEEGLAAALWELGTVPNGRDSKEIARLARKVAREADRITALKRARAALDQAVADGLATRLPEGPQEATP